MSTVLRFSLPSARLLLRHSQGSRVGQPKGAHSVTTRGVDCAGTLRPARLLFCHSPGHLGSVEGNPDAAAAHVRRPGASLRVGRTGVRDDSASAQARRERHQGLAPGPAAAVARSPSGPSLPVRLATTGAVRTA